MAYGNRYGSFRRGARVSTDRFGNPFQLKFAAQKVDRKSGELVNAYQTFVELGGKLYKVEVSEAQKTKEIRGEERNGMWVKVTAVHKQSAATM